MSEQNTKKEQAQETQEEKREYTKPEILEEDLIAFGGACEGTPGGGFKASSGAPHYCNPAKLLS